MRVDIPGFTTFYLYHINININILWSEVRTHYICGEGGLDSLLNFLYSTDRLKYINGLIIVADHQNRILGEIINRIFQSELKSYFSIDKFRQSEVLVGRIVTEEGEICKC